MTSSLVHYRARTATIRGDDQQPSALQGQNCDNKDCDQDCRKHEGIQCAFVSHRQIMQAAAAGAAPAMGGPLCHTVTLQAKNEAPPAGGPLGFQVLSTRGIWVRSG